MQCTEYIISLFDCKYRLSCPSSDRVKLEKQHLRNLRLPHFCCFACWQAWILQTC